MSFEEAYSHTLKELQLDNLKESLRLEYSQIQPCHDAIHEFLLLAPTMFPSTEVSWHSKSIFILYNWEAFGTAHRSIFEALCGYYNAAFMLLRSVLELVLKGTFFECLAHKTFRENSSVLDSDKDNRGKNLKALLYETLQSDPTLADKWEHTPVSLYDAIGLKMDEPKYRLGTKLLLKQLRDWGLLDPIPNVVHSIGKIYQVLSKDVHVLPDRMDVGRILLHTPEDLFDPKKIYPSQLREYLTLLQAVMDLGIVTVLNLFQDHIQYPEVRINLEKRERVIKGLHLMHSATRMKALLTK